MIDAHQATIFPSEFFVATSSIKNNIIRHPSLHSKASSNIRAWCNTLEVKLESTVGLYITYGSERTYTSIVEVKNALHPYGASNEKGWIKADAFVTQTPGIAMLLPIADCNAVVYVDPVKKIMALLHLGWHSTVRNLATKVICYMTEHFGTKPQDILVYNSPSIGAASYIFTYLEQTPDVSWHNPPYVTKLFDGRFAVDLVKYNYDQWIKAGISPKHVQIVNVDTATSPDYPSHYSGQAERFAVLAQISKR